MPHATPWVPVLRRPGGSQLPTPKLRSHLASAGGQKGLCHRGCAPWPGHAFRPLYPRSGRGRATSTAGPIHPREASAPGRSSPSPPPPPWAAPCGSRTALLLLGLLPHPLLPPARSVGISANSGERARPVRAPGAWGTAAHAPPAARALAHSCLAAVRGAAREKEGRLDSHLCPVRTFRSVVRGMRARLKIDGA